MWQRRASCGSPPDPASRSKSSTCRMLAIPNSKQRSSSTVQLKGTPLIMAAVGSTPTSQIKDRQWRLICAPTRSFQRGRSAALTCKDWLLYAAASVTATLSIIEVSDDGKFHLKALVPTSKGVRGVAAGKGQTAYLIDPAQGRILKLTHKSHDETKDS